MVSIGGHSVCLWALPDPDGVDIWRCQEHPIGCGAWAQDPPSYITHAYPIALYCIAGCTRHSRVHPARVMVRDAALTRALSVPLIVQ